MIPHTLQIETINGSGPGFCVFCNEPFTAARRVVVVKGDSALDRKSCEECYSDGKKWGFW